MPRADTKYLLVAFGLVSTGLVNMNTADAQIVLRRVVLDSPIIRIGSPPQSETEEIELLAAALLFPDGGAVLSDRSKKRLIHISAKHLVRAVGRAGAGPGEMREPSSLLWVSATEFEVLDRALSRLSRYAATPTELRYTGATTLKHIPDDICAVMGGYVSLRYDPTTRSILHSVSSDGREVSSFGTPLFAGSHFLNEVATQGRILCLPDQSSVVVAPSLTGELRKYSLGGQLLWRTEFASHLPPDVREVRGPGILFGWYPRGQDKSHVGMSLTRLDAEHILVQFGLRTREKKGTGSGADFAHVESRIVRITDGREVGRQLDLPILLHTFGSRAVVTGEEPEPWAEIRPYRLSTRNP